MSEPKPWRRSSPYSITRGQWAISMAKISGVERYILWRDARMTSPVYDSAEEARAAADRLEAEAKA